MKVMLLNALDGLGATDQRLALGQSNALVAEKLEVARALLARDAARARLPVATYTQLRNEGERIAGELATLIDEIDSGAPFDARAIAARTDTLDRATSSFDARVRNAVSAEGMSRPVKIVLWTLGIGAAAALGVGIAGAIRRGLR